MVVENSAVKQREFQQQIIENPAILHHIWVSSSTTARILNKQHLLMKQIYRDPFERDSQRVKDKQYEYMQ